MKKETLYRFFEGKATYDEEKRIREWMERSDNHLVTVIQARKEYDALLLAGYISHTTSPHISNERGISPFARWLVGISAAIVLALMLAGLYLLTGKRDAESYNTVIVPPGQRINIILSDSTNLWLNANTTFQYPTEFAKGSRTVFLDGEAYLEVSKNEKKPFIVKTGQGDVRVTGTILNIEAYSKYNSFTTSLFDGGVDIYQGEKKLASLQPNEKSVWSDNRIVISPITDPDEYLWRDGLIAFKNKKLEEILKTLERYFDVTIQVNGNRLPRHTYTGKFRQADGVDYALRVLQRSIRFNYERDEETGTVFIK
ncbi:MAG TPA: DUF4974 domain-containing protein [Bacteroidales bacterium]|jgi:ferric-dicitrate binding protein FerR (iron transport regulator)|nr:DUF4974 domain-containing protein [Bacteroidales bacterium]